MKRAQLACLLLALIQTATAQVRTGIGDVRELSARWAEYYAAIYRVPVDLVDAIIDEESAWNPFAVSPKGAVGLMQLMPETAVRFGVRKSFSSGREHPGRRRLSILVEPAIQRRPQTGHRGLLRR